MGINIYYQLRGSHRWLGWQAILGGLLAAVILFFVMNAPTVWAAMPLTCGTSEINFVGHQDDDILFMNPDISESIEQGRCIETVYMTAGEWNGTETMTREQYGASRNEGARAAYAMMAQVPNDWARETIPFNGNLVEVATLRGAPNVKHIYMSIRDNADSLDLYSLSGLYTRSRPTSGTIVPTGSPAGIVPVQYTKSGLTQVLSTIITNYKATVLRVQDYLPDPRSAGNHPDHIYSALFAVDAARNYRGVNNNLHVKLVTYRDYNITTAPVNLSPDQVARKNAIISAYKPYDTIFALPADQTVIAGRMYYRWPVAPTWVTANKDGRLQAFDVQAGRLVTWQQDAAGNWSNMQSLGNSLLQPGIGVGMNTDGTLQVFAVKQTISAQGVVRQDVQFIRQLWANGPFGSWVNLGNPGTASNGTYDISSPAVVSNGDGRLEVFLKDSNGNLSTIYQNLQGSYSPWVGLGGNGNLVEMPATLLRTDGRIEVYSATRDIIYHWLQRTPNGAVEFDTNFVSARAVGTPSAGFNQDARPEIFYRHPDDGTVYSIYETLSGMWSPGETAISGQSSQGAPAVVSTMPVLTTGSRILLISRTPSQFETVAQVSDNNYFGLPWQPINTAFSQHSPAGYLDNQNRVHFLNITQDGVLVDHVPL